MSATAFAALLGRSVGHMKKLENGQRPIVLEIAVPLCRLTGIPLQHLAREEELRIALEAAELMGYRASGKHTPRLKRVARKGRRGKA